MRQRTAGGQLIVIVTGGEFEWDEEAAALSPSSTAISAEVRSRLTTEPLYVDLRWARIVADLSLRDTRFRTAIVRIAATIRGMAPADLESEDVRCTGTPAASPRPPSPRSSVLALVASVAAVVAVANARRADRPRPRCRSAGSSGSPPSTCRRARSTRRCCSRLPPPTSTAATGGSRRAGC